MSDSSFPPLLTPIYLKASEDQPWPAEQGAFYLLAGNDLFLCRNHEWFTSCVPAPRWPSELAQQQKFLELRYPKIPRTLVEQVVGFFDHVGREHQAEAAVLLGWDGQRVRVIVPPQTATVSVGWHGRQYPMDVQYGIPKLPPAMRLIGDIHSHVDLSAYASHTDVADEQRGAAGLHVVVGRLFSGDPPEFHIDVTVDGSRFTVTDPAAVFEGYAKRDLNFPRAWLKRHNVKPWSYAKSYDVATTNDPYRKDGRWRSQID